VPRAPRLPDGTRRHATRDYLFKNPGHALVVLAHDRPVFAGKRFVEGFSICGREPPARTLRWQRFAADLFLGPASVQECPLGKLVDKRTFRIMYLAGIASRSLTFDWLGLGFRATCFDGDLHGTFHRIFEGHLDSEQSVLVGRFGFVRFYRPT
jgi:hypothetical protein